MGFFNKKKTAALRDVGNDPITSIVGKDMVLTGNISFQGKLRLDGKVEGDVKGENLILGDSGHITGDVDAQIFVCHGVVSGDIKVQKLFAIEGCRIQGTIQATDLSVESGASLFGEIKASGNGASRTAPEYASAMDEQQAGAAYT